MVFGQSTGRAVARLRAGGMPASAIAQESRPRGLGKLHILRNHPDSRPSNQRIEFCR